MAGDPDKINLHSLCNCFLEIFFLKILVLNVGNCWPPPQNLGKNIVLALSWNSADRVESLFVRNLDKLHEIGVESKMAKCEMRESWGVLEKMNLEKQGPVGTQSYLQNLEGLKKKKKKQRLKVCLCKKGKSFFIASENRTRTKDWNLKQGGFQVITRMLFLAKAAQITAQLPPGILAFPLRWKGTVWAESEDWRVDWRV